MEITELNLMQPKNLTKPEFKTYVNIIKDWYKEAVDELYEDINKSDYCKLYLVLDENKNIAGGIIISNIQTEEYDDIKPELYNQLLKLSSLNYYYLMWFYIKANYRGLGYGNYLMNHVQKKYRKLCLETENDKLV